MADSTPHLNLYKPGGGSTGTITPDEVADIDRINQNMDIIDGAIETLDEFRASQVTRNQQFRGPAASIGAVVGMVRGDTYQEMDGSFLRWAYDGTGWVYAPGQILFEHIYAGGNITTLNSGTVFTSAANLPANQKVRLELDRFGMFATSVALAASEFRYRSDGTAVLYNTGTLVGAQRVSLPGGSNVCSAPGQSARLTMPAAPQKLSAGLFFTALGAGSGGIYGADGVYIRAYSE